MAGSEVDFLVGQKIVQIRYPGLRLVFDEGDRVEPALYADLSEFTLSRGGVEEKVDASDPATIEPLLRLVGKTVNATETPDDASLELTFSDGTRLRCEAHERYEAWQVVGGAPQYLVVSVGPGKLSVYEGPSEPLG